MFRKGKAVVSSQKYYAAKWYPMLHEWGFSSEYKTEDDARKRMLEMDFDQVVTEEEKWRLLEDQHTAKLEKELGIH